MEPITVKVTPEMIRRFDILKVLAEMPEEAFSWLVLAMPSKAMLHGGNAQIWPDGIGGFTKESKASIEAARAAADVYLKGETVMANVDINQVLSLTSVIAPLIISFVHERQQDGQGVPTLEEVNAHIAQHADTIVADIERMQREHPRTPEGEANG